MNATFAEVAAQLVVFALFSVCVVAGGEKMDERLREARAQHFRRGVNHVCDQLRNGCVDGRFAFCEVARKVCVKP